MAIAERESIAHGKLEYEILKELEGFYGEHPRNDAGEDELPRHFAHDLRIGAFEGSSRDRRAREILWRLTIVKLRLANPRFLAANGFR
jgi:hypothetical protein